MTDLILLHGAIGADDQLNTLAEGFTTKNNVHTLCFYGHGFRNDDSVFSIPLFTQQLEQYITENKLHKPIVLGYSMGGYVAMHYAYNHPSSLKAIITLGTKFAWSEDIAKKEVGMLNPARIQEKVPAFAAVLQRRHGKKWMNVLDKTAAMMMAMGETPPLQDEQFSHITIPVLCCIGDRDNMVTAAETKQTFQLLTTAQLFMVPGTPHPIEKLNYPAFIPVVQAFIDSLSQ